MIASANPAALCRTLVAALLAVLLLLQLARGGRAFAPPALSARGPAAPGDQRSAATRVRASWSPWTFLSGGDRAPERPAPTPNRSAKRTGTAPSPAAAPTAREPFVFLIGRPQHDWGTGRPRVDAQGARKVQFDWGRATAARGKSPKP